MKTGNGATDLTGSRSVEPIASSPKNRRTAAFLLIDASSRGDRCTTRSGSMVKSPTSNAASWVGHAAMPLRTSSRSLFCESRQGLMWLARRSDGPLSGGNWKPQKTHARPQLAKTSPANRCCPTERVRATAERCPAPRCRPAARATLRARSRRRSRQRRDRALLGPA